MDFSALGNWFLPSDQQLNLPYCYFLLLISPKPADLFVADWSVLTPGTPGPREDAWPARQNSGNSGHFELSCGSPAKQTAISIDAGNRRMAPHSSFGGGVTNTSSTIRNLILSPMKRPQLSRNRPQMFT